MLLEIVPKSSKVAASLAVSNRLFVECWLSVMGSLLESQGFQTTYRQGAFRYYIQQEKIANSCIGEHPLAYAGSVFINKLENLGFSGRAVYKGERENPYVCLQGLFQGSVC